MTDPRPRYVPADRVCLFAGIGLSFAVALVVWLVIGRLGAYGILSLGVIAAVGGMLLAGVCARIKERSALGKGGATDPRQRHMGPAEEADDPMREMERDVTGGQGPAKGRDGTDA